MTEEKYTEELLEAIETGYKAAEDGIPLKKIKEVAGETA